MKILKILGILAGVLAVIVIAGLIYFNAAFPKVDPPSNIKVEVTPERLARGEYLANHVSNCMDCHSTRDWSKYAGPVIKESLGKGGEKFSDEISPGFPGVVFAKNITPANLSSWTDGELI